MLQPMQLILIAIICLAAGAVIGFLFQKAKSQHLAVENELLKSQKNDFDKFHEESLKSAKAVMGEISRDVSKELLDHHKRENIEAKKQAEEITRKETEKLHNEFKSVVEQLAAMRGQNQMSEKKLSAIWQSLTSPVKASNFAEIGLENTLKNFGLEPGVDFNMQASLNHDGARLRPDAIINLPAGNLIIIDAKTSKYFIELAAEVADAEILKTKLKASMNTHLQQLTARDYAAAGRNHAEGNYVVNVMYLNNESYYGKILECDGNFDRNCREAGVLLVTPSSLNMLLNIATHQIARARAERNYQQISREMGKVVSSVDNLLRGLNDVGIAIRRSAEAFSKLSGPVNSRVIPRIRNMLKLGLEPEREVKLPESLPNFNIIENEAVMLEAESEATPLKVLEKKAGWL